MTTLATILFSIAFFLFDIATIIAIVLIICKIVAKAKARKAAKKDTKKTDDTTPDTPVDNKKVDNTTGADKKDDGTSTASEEAKPCACTEVGALEKATEALEAAKVADDKATEALEANQATDKKVEEEKAEKAEKARQAFMLENAEEIELYSLRFTKAYKAYGAAVHYGNAVNDPELSKCAQKASKQLCTSESNQIRKDAGYSYSTDLKREGYQDIGRRQRLEEEVAPEAQSALDELELKGFCNADAANAELETAIAEADAANKAVERNNAEVASFDNAAEAAVDAMKAAYAGLKDCKLNDEEIAAKVRLSVAMIKAIVG